MTNDSNNKKPDKGKKPPTLHEQSWEAHIAEIHLKGNSIKEAYHPLLFSLLCHIGQNSVLCSRSAMMAGDKKKAHDLLNYARLCSAIATVFNLVASKGIEGGAEHLEKAVKGDEVDPAKELMSEWIKSVGQIPASHISQMAGKVLGALRYSEEGDFIRMKWDETLCGLNDYDNPKIKAHLKSVMERMGIRNESPAIVEADEDGLPMEDGETNKEIGGGYSIRKKAVEGDADKEKPKDDDDLPPWMKSDRFKPLN
jgi:hypothetical protein